MQVDLLLSPVLTLQQSHLSPHFPNLLSLLRFGGPCGYSPELPFLMVHVSSPCWTSTWGPQHSWTRRANSVVVGSSRSKGSSRWLGGTPRGTCAEGQIVARPTEIGRGQTVFCPTVLGEGCPCPKRGQVWGR